VAVRLRGIGYPGRGTGDGRSYIGPGVDRRWTQQHGQYVVSVGYSGSRISLLVWRFNWAPTNRLTEAASRTGVHVLGILDLLSTVGILGSQRQRPH
jgi:hypothetical protein